MAPHYDHYQDAEGVSWISIGRSSDGIQALSDGLHAHNTKRFAIGKGDNR